ncbi:MAG: hypothetical protein CO129_10765 [Ignavibacteriales bacterium CG_4_9_14_3_um_filter_34_10]|nr:MAG: hypothetical protein CO129_10765 [Ignavibacteriales bacterium CG_4_9_14_3_um_filter_34_10]
MKNLNLIVFVFICAAFFGSSNLTDTPVAVIKKTVNKVMQKDSQKDWVTSKTGDILFDGMEVKTGYKSLAIIKFTDNSGVLTVRENCVANIYAAQKNKKMDKNTLIQQGTVHFDVNKQAPDEEFKFTTPTVVASIRGTSGYIEVEKDSSTNIICEKGLIQVEALMGKKEKGQVAAGGSLSVSAEGLIQKGEINSEQSYKLKKSRQSEVKTLKIKTPDGVLEIKYLPEEE